jgi:hypothetical protein
MRLKLSPKFFAASLLVLSSCATMGCKGKGPVVFVCVSDPESKGFQCSNGKVETFLPYGASENYIALSPRDFEAQAAYWRTRCK